jgi:hypothetical protein
MESLLSSQKKDLIHSPSPPSNSFIPGPTLLRRQNYYIYTATNSLFFLHEQKTERTSKRQFSRVTENLRPTPTKILPPDRFKD